MTKIIVESNGEIHELPFYHVTNPLNTNMQLAQKKKSNCIDYVPRYRVYTLNEVKKMHYRTGELAKKCNLNKETIRYYERIGILPEPLRTDSGYRIYSEETVDRLNFIMRMQELGFKLKEIDKLLGVVDQDEAKCHDMYDFTLEKLEDIRRKIKDLKRIEQMLIDLKESCPENKDIYECPIIERLMKK